MKKNFITSSPQSNFYTEVPNFKWRPTATEWVEHHQQHPVYACSFM